MKKSLLNRFLKALYSGLLSFLALSLAQASPLITSFSPSSGPIGTTVTIVGTGFNATGSNNLVFFGTTKATVQSVSGGNTILTVVVPYGANYNYISVTDLSSNLTTYSAIPFVVTFTPTGDNTFRPLTTVAGSNGSSSKDVTIADINLDGKPDLVFINSKDDIYIFPNTTSSITAVVSFGSSVSLLVGGSASTHSLVVADIDGDGWPDIANINSSVPDMNFGIANTPVGTSKIFVYLNKTGTVGGTPSFGSKSSFTTANTSVFLTAGDLDSDGKPDIVVVSQLSANNVSVLRNTSVSGSISFTAFQTFSAGSNPTAVAIGDLNNDGKPDVVVANGGANTVSVFKNQSSVGAISLATPGTFTAGTTPSSIALGDLNLDGFLDIVVSNSGGNTVSVFNNRAFTSSISFSSAVNITSSSGPSSARIGDTNGDGWPDIVVANTTSNTGVVLQNTSTTGTLSFTISPDITGGSVTSPSRLSIGDLNADGKPDVVFTNSSNTNNVSVFLQRITQSITITSANSLTPGSSFSVTVSQSVSPTSLGGGLTYSVTAGSGSATVNASGNLRGVSAGTITLIVTALGATDYASASVSQLITISGSKTTPTLTITSANTLLVDGTLTGTVTTTATGGLGGAITYAIVAGSGSATVNPSTGLIKGISAGTLTLTATSAGDANYYSASTSQLITIGQSTPLLIVTSANTMLVDGTLTATVTTTASQAVGTLSYSVNNNTGSAIVDSGTGIITAFSAGTITLTVTSSGNANYASASVDQLITIGQATPTLTISSANTMTIGDVITPSVNTTATFGRGGIITLSIIGGSGSATIDPGLGTITAIRAGAITLVASSVGDNDYNPATTSQLITINRVTQTLTITSANSLGAYSALTATVVTTATDGQGGTITYAIVRGSGSVTVNPSTGLIIGISAGTVTLVATSSGDSYYGPSSVTQQITVSQLTPTLTIISPNVMTAEGTLLAAVSTTAIQVGAVRYSIVNGSSGVALVNPSTGLIRAIRRGTVTLMATSAATTNYVSASVTQTITISKGGPVLTITSANWVDVGGTLTVTLNILSDRGGSKRFVISAGSGSATINSSRGLIRGVSAGTVTLTVTSSGDDDYDPLTASQLITIGKTTPTLNVISANAMAVGSSLTAEVAMTPVISGQRSSTTFAVSAGSGSATVDPTTGLIRAIAAGTITLTVNSASNTNYFASSTSQLITIGKATPTLYISLANAVVIDGTSTSSVTTTATGGRGGAITFAVSAGSGSATVNPITGLITTIGAGTVTIMASSAGDTDYNASSTNRVITIGKRTPVLAITSANSISGMTGNLTATTTSTATGGRGGIITYTIVAGSGSATVNANTGFIQAAGIGTVTLRANSAGDTDYNASSTSQLITIGKSEQVLMITSSNVMVVDGTLVASVTSTVSNGGTIIYSIKNGRGAVLVNPRTGLIQATMHGTVTLIASTAGNSSYMPATTSQVITIGKSTPTLTITSPNNMLVGQSLRARVNTTATYERGGKKSYSILAGSGSATVDSSTGLIQAIGSGTFTLVVSSAGDVDYNASSCSQLITISNGGGLLVVEPSKEGSSEGSVSPAIELVPSVPTSSPEDHVRDYEIEASKAVSPNGDGLEDKFVIEHIGNYPQNEVVIADRRGEVVFKVHGYDNETVVFGGQSNNGVSVVDGMYYYTIILYDHGVVNRFVGYFKLKR